MEKVVFREDWYRKGVPPGEPFPREFPFQLQSLLWSWSITEGSRAVQPDFSRLEEAYARAIELVPSVEGAQVDAKAAVFSMTADGYPLVG